MFNIHAEIKDEILYTVNDRLILHVKLKISEFIKKIMMYQKIQKFSV